MTSKEILYVEDALEHEQYFKTKCSEITSQIQDSELKNTVQSSIQKHNQIFNSFLDLLN